jgi:hypothetical protein
VWYARTITIVFYPFLARYPYKSSPLLMSATIQTAYERAIPKAAIKPNDGFSPIYHGIHEPWSTLLNKTVLRLLRDFFVPLPLPLHFPSSIAPSRKRELWFEMMMRPLTFPSTTWLYDLLHVYRPQEWCRYRSQSPSSISSPYLDGPLLPRYAGGLKALRWERKDKTIQQAGFPDGHLL